MFKSYLSDAATGLITNPSSPQYLWRTLLYTADQCCFHKLEQNDHELLALQYDWHLRHQQRLDSHAGSRALPKGGWQSLHCTTKQRQNGHSSCHGASGTFCGIFDWPVSSAQMTMWRECLDQRRKSPSMAICSPQQTLLERRRNAAQSNKDAVLTRGKAHRAHIVFERVRQGHDAIERQQSRCATCFGLLPASRIANALVAFARRLGIGPADKRRKREFEGNLKSGPRGNVFPPLVRAHSTLHGRCTGLAMPIAQACDQTPEDAVRQSQGR